MDNMPLLNDLVEYPGSPLAIQMLDVSCHSLLLRSTLSIKRHIRSEPTQACLRRIRLTAYRCFLPDLTGFTGRIAQDQRSTAGRARRYLMLSHYSIWRLKRVAGSCRANNQFFVVESRSRCMLSGISCMTSIRFPSGSLIQARRDPHRP